MRYIHHAVSISNTTGNLRFHDTRKRKSSSWQVLSQIRFIIAVNLQIRNSDITLQRQKSKSIQCEKEDSKTWWKQAPLIFRPDAVRSSNPRRMCCILSRSRTGYICWSGSTTAQAFWSSIYLQLAFNKVSHICGFYRPLADTAQL